MPYVDFVNEDRFDEMEALTISLFGEDIDCVDCGLWEPGKEDGTCLHYINEDCPFGYCDEYQRIKD